jgi:hypothetical protein
VEQRWEGKKPRFPTMTPRVVGPFLMAAPHAITAARQAGSTS